MDKRGYITILSVFTIPIIISLLGIIIDGGRYMIIKSQLESIAELAANAGASTIGDLKFQKESEYYNESVDYSLTTSDWEEIEQSYLPKETAEQFIEINMYKEITNLDKTIEYPLTTTANEITIKVTLKSDLATTFPLILVKDNISVTTSAISSIQK